MKIKITESQAKRLKIIKEGALLNIDTKLAFKIYDILATKHPEIATKYSKSAFFHLLNDNLG